MDSGYRQYTEADVHTLHFIRRSRASSQVKRIAQAHIDDLSERIAAMQAMQRTLKTLVSCCQGNDRPDCPILDDLAAAPGTPPAPRPARPD